MLYSLSRSQCPRWWRLNVTPQGYISVTVMDQQIDCIGISVCESNFAALIWLVQYQNLIYLRQNTIAIFNNDMHCAQTSAHYPCSCYVLQLTKNLIVSVFLYVNPILLHNWMWLWPCCLHWYYDNTYVHLAHRVNYVSPRAVLVVVLYHLWTVPRR